MSISADGHDFTVFHPETGETLQISQVFGVDAGLGVPGSSDGGAMHVSGYFQALPKILTTTKMAEGGAGSVGEGVEENEADLEGEEGMEDVLTPSDGRGNPAAGAVGDDADVEDYEGKEDNGEEENDGGEDDGEEDSEGGEGGGEGTRGGQDDRTEGIIKALERVSPVRNLLVTKEASRYLCLSRVWRALEILVDRFRLNREVNQIWTNQNDLDYIWANSIGQSDGPIIIMRISQV